MKMFFLAHALLLCWTVLADPVWRYEKTPEGVVIEGGGDKAIERLDIPDSIDGLPVIGIKPWAFACRKALKHVRIPSCVRSVGDHAFYDCGLLDVELSEGLKTVGSMAFSRCFSLASIYIPDSVASLGETPFPPQCTVLKARDLRLREEAKAAEAKRLHRVRTQGANLNDFFNIAFYRDVAEQMRKLGILSEETADGKTRFFCLGMESDTFCRELPSSRRFAGFRVHTLFVDGSNSLIGVASSYPKICKKSELVGESERVIAEVNRMLASVDRPLHKGSSDSHKWRWSINDCTGRRVYILLVADSVDKGKDLWMFSLLMGVRQCEPDEDVPVSGSVSGTGWFVNSNCVVTCEHVVSGAKTIKIVDSVGRRYNAVLVAADKEKDLAVLRVHNACCGHPLGINDRLAGISTHVFTIGYPYAGLVGSEQQYTDGVISAASGLNSKKYYQISIPIQPGNSGGAVVNDCGQVVGVAASSLDALAVAKITGSIPQNVNYAVKSRYVTELLEDSQISFRVDTALRTDCRSDTAKFVSKATVLVLVMGGD